MINILEDSIRLINGFERAINTSRMVPNKIYLTEVLVQDIPNVDSSEDFSDFLLEMVENSKKYTSYWISKREFSLQTRDSGEYLVLRVEFFREGSDFKLFKVPFKATIEDYMGILPITY